MNTRGLAALVNSNCTLQLTSNRADILCSHLAQPGSSVSICGHVVEVTFCPNGTVRFSFDAGFTAEAEIVPERELLPGFTEIMSVLPSIYRRYPITTVLEDASSRVVRPNPTVVRSTGFHAVDNSAERRQLTVTDDATISARGSNRINAGDRSTVHSISSNLFTHDGMGGGIIDGGGIEFSGFTEERE